MARQLNTVTVIGNLVRDPELTYTNSQIAKTRITIANNRDYLKDGNEVKKVNFFEVETWGRLAEVCNEHLKKGNQIAVSGELDQSRWEDSEGNNKSRIIIKITSGGNINFLTPKKQTENSVNNENKNTEDDNIPF